MTADHRVLIDLPLFMAGARTFKCCAIKAAEWIDCIPDIPETVIFVIGLKCNLIVYLCPRKPGAMENPDNDIRKSNMKDQCSFSYEKICLNMLQFLRTYFDMYQGKKLTSCLNASCSEMINI